MRTHACRALPVLIVALCAFPLSRGEAQTASAVSSAQWAANGGWQFTDPCLFGNTDAIEASIARSCEFAQGLTGSTFASVRAGGPIRVSASVTASAEAVFERASVHARGSFTDILAFGALVPTYAVFDLEEDGSIFGDVGELYGESSLTSYFYNRSGGTCSSDEFWQTISPSAHIQQQNAAGYQFTAYVGPQSVLSRRSVVCDVSSASFAFSYDLLSSAGMRYRTTGTHVGSATVDFSSTARVAGLRFLDANGADISNDVQYDAASGARYGTFAVPEPATGVLLTAGLVVMGILAARGRRMTHDGT